MDTSGHTTIASNSTDVATNRGDDNDSRSGAGADCDEDDGEPPNIRRFIDVESTSSFFRRTIPFMTNCQPPLGRWFQSARCPRGDRSKIQRRTLHYFSPWAGAMATFAVIFLFHPNKFLAAAEDSSKEVSWIYEEAGKKIPAAHAETSSGLRGAIIQSVAFSDDEIMASLSGNCNYQCCLAILDVHSDQSRQLSGSISDTGSLQESSNATHPCPSEKDDKDDSNSGGATAGMPIAVQYLLIIILVMFSALFSGLTLGLMSLDPSGLEIVMANADDPKLARAAKAIYPVRLNGNLLLCTLLLGNVGVNSMLSILMADMSSGLIGFIVSTAVIVIFGEIIPQAICSRFALQIGEKTVPLVKVIMVLLYPICKPLSFVLNKVLGHEIGTTYSTSEMAKLIEMHVQRGDLEGATGAAMTGALQYRSVPVSEVMTPLANTFMLSADERLGFDTVAKIFRTGYSRIPVYEVSKNNIIGLLFVKDLIFLDPEDEIPVKNFVQIFGRGLHVVWPDDKLEDLLKLLKRGRSHMAIVRGVNNDNGELDPYYEITGIITLEDIIEVILGDEIVDETDQLVDVNDPHSLVQTSEHMGDYIEGAIEKSNGHDFTILEGGVSDQASVRVIDWEARLRLLDERLVDEHLSSDEVRAVAAHLKMNYSRAVELISDKQLKELLSSVPVTEVSPAQTCATEDGGDDGSGVPTDCAELIYKRGVPADFCTVVLSGKIMVISGADRFRSDVSNWGVLASRSLTDPSYVPDFSAWVLPNQNSSGGCRCIKLDRESYCAAVDNTALEKTDHNVAISASITNELPLVQNWITGQESANDGDIGSSTDIGPGSRVPKKANSSKQLDPLPDLAVTPLSPQTPGDDVPVERKAPSYVKTDVQIKTHSRRSKLLKAFTRASNKKDGVK